MARRPIILTLLAPYWPAADANGPVRSLVHLVRALSSEFEFRILGRDRPYGAHDTMPSGDVGSWIPHEGGYVRYEPPSRLRIQFFRDFLRDTPHDVLYLNSLFERDFGVLPLLARRLMWSRQPTIIAPRGELGRGAIQIRRARKTAFIACSKIARLHSGAAFQATSDLEQREIQKHFSDVPVYVCPNMALMRRPPRPAPRSSTPLRIVYLSRIAEKKNLALALHALSQVMVPVTFHIYGPVSEAAYWTQCQTLMAKLPGNVAASYLGEVAGQHVPEKLAEYDLLFLPTASENFGHAIVEALAAGVPVLISDRTPWRGLEAAEAGFDLPLDEIARFSRTIERFAGFDDAKRVLFADGAAAFARRAVDLEKSIHAYRAMFNAQLAAA
jgi:glycosyltransferase involved in cell wall biosynthesis